MSQEAEYTIRWVLTHDPISLFEEAARRFASIVREESGGRMEVQVFTPTEYGSGRRIPAEEVMTDVAEGQLEMSQTYSTVLGKLHEPLWALDLPLLFGSHAHAARVLEGRIGGKLLDGLRPAGLRGLAFTYSGGYRIVSTTGRTLTRPEDLLNLRIRTAENPVVADFFTRLGARPHPAPLPAIPALTAENKIDAAESTWPRYWDMGHHEVQPVVHETGHSLFLTALVVNESYYERLPIPMQQVLLSAAFRVARLERLKSVKDGEKAREAFLRRGGMVIELTPSLLAAIEQAAAGVYEQFIPRFGRELIDAIRTEAAAA